MGIPEGYALVPIEPTAAMLDAAVEPIWKFSPDYAPTARDPKGEVEDSAENVARSAFAAMLTAAPKPGDPKPITDADLYIECP